MSNPMKIITALFVVLLLVAVVLTMFGKPPNLPLGPLQGMLASDDASEVTTEPVTTQPESSATDDTCPPGYIKAPASSAPTIDPETGAPVEGGAGADATAQNTPDNVSDCIPDPNADPADLGAAQGAGGEAPNADHTQTPPDTGAQSGTQGDQPDAQGSGTQGGAQGSSGQNAGPNHATVAGVNSGNSPEALRVASDVADVMQQAKITVAVDSMLLPVAGGVSAPNAIKKYRNNVTAAALVIKLTDPTALEQWKSAGKKVQTDLVRSFIQRLGKNYPKATRSVSVVDSTGMMLAVGDARVGGGAKAGVVKIY